MLPPTFLEFIMAYFGQSIQYEFYSVMKAGHSDKSKNLLASSGITCWHVPE